MPRERAGRRAAPPRRRTSPAGCGRSRNPCSSRLPLRLGRCRWCPGAAPHIRASMIPYSARDLRQRCFWIKRARRGRSRQALGPLPEWDLADLYPGRDSPELRARPGGAGRRRGGVPGALRGQARGSVGRRTRRRGRGIRAAAGNRRPDHELCRAAARRQCRRPRDRAASSRRCTSASTRSRPSCCSSRWNSTGSTTPRSTPSWPTRRWRITGRGCATCARCGRTSSATSWKSCCTRNRSPAAPPGCGCSTRPIAELRFPFRGRELTEAEAMHLLSDPDGAVRREAALSIGEVLGKNGRVFALITNTLAKDKEIEDRWRKFPAADLGAQPVEFCRGRGRRRADRGGARQLPEPVAPLLPAEGALVRGRAIAVLGPQRAAAGR